MQRGTRGPWPPNGFDFVGFSEILMFRQMFAVGKDKSFESYRKTLELGPSYSTGATTPLQATHKIKYRRSGSNPACFVLQCVENKIEVPQTFSARQRPLKVGNLFLIETSFYCLSIAVVIDLLGVYDHRQIY